MTPKLRVLSVFVIELKCWSIDDAAASEDLVHTTSSKGIVKTKTLSQIQGPVSDLGKLNRN